MKITPFFRWYDLWIGAYIDVEGRAIYVCPIPMFGLKVEWGRCEEEDETVPISWRYDDRLIDILPECISLAERYERSPEAREFGMEHGIPPTVAAFVFWMHREHREAWDRKKGL